MTVVRLISPGLLFTLALAGCGGDSSGSVTGPGPPAAGPAPATTKTWPGRYVGSVLIDGETYFADGVLTVDGLIRLYISGPSPSNGALPITTPQDSAQLVGNYVAAGDQATASGVLIAERCGTAQFVRLCNGSGAAKISFVGSPTHATTIQITTSGSSETWQLELNSWSNNLYPASLQQTEGQYSEKIAVFESEGDTVIRIDRTGQLFFQAAQSGCTGNGRLVPHLDGRFNVYDVTVTIGNCSAKFSHLNGEFEGLATSTSGSIWDYDLMLRAWLSKPNATSSQVAITMLADHM